MVPGCVLWGRVWVPNMVWTVDSIPVDWISKTTCGKEILSMAVDLAKL